MNRFKRFTTRLSICAVLATSVIAARAQVTPANLTAVTNLPAIINGASASNTTSYIFFQKGKGMGLQILSTVSSGTANQQLQLFFSVDGTNYATTPLILTRATGTSDIWPTNFPAATLDGYVSMKFGAWSNAAASGGGIITNQGVLFGFRN